MPIVVGNVVERAASPRYHGSASETTWGPTHSALSSLASSRSGSRCRNGIDGETGCHGVYRGGRDGDRGALRRVSQVSNSTAMTAPQRHRLTSRLRKGRDSSGEGSQVGIELMGLCSQLRHLKPLIESLPSSHPSLPLLRDILTEFRDDELEHLDTAVEEGAQKAPGHSLLSAVIGLGCKAAIKVCERI